MNSRELIVRNIADKLSDEYEDDDVLKIVEKMVAYIRDLEQEIEDLEMEIDE